MVSGYDEAVPREQGTYRRGILDRLVGVGPCGFHSPPANMSSAYRKILLIVAGTGPNREGPRAAPVWAVRFRRVLIRFWHCVRPRCVCRGSRYLLRVPSWSLNQRRKEI